MPPTNRKCRAAALYCAETTARIKPRLFDATAFILQHLHVLTILL